MRERKSARLLVVSPARKVLLFRFLHKDGALAGHDYWATPGGGLEDGETFEVAAVRELLEETGIQVHAVGTSVAERVFPMMLPSGEMVRSVERYFVVRAADERLSNSGWTASEVQVMADHQWWSESDLRQTRDVVWPENLIDMLERAAAFQRD
ncbi:NUDIX domain-containing protein [Pseudomonas purpurea]|uniref:NUDIX hydrolase n=1 Tax=Pseudomonas purpurea TaxID=3136737 RepID=UPI003265C040